MTSYVTPKKNTQYIFYVGLVSQADTKLLKVNPTIAAGDFKVSADGGALTNLGTLPTSGRSIDVSAGGAVGVDWANVESPTTVVGLSGTTVKTATDVEADTADIQSRLPAALVSGRMDSSVGAMAANVMTAAAAAADLTTELQNGLATAADLATLTGYVDTEVAAIKAKTDNLPASPAAVSDIPTANQNADALLDRANAVETGLTPRQALRLLVAALAGKLSGATTTTITIRNAVADSKDRIVATVDADGNRTAVTTDVT